MKWMVWAFLAFLLVCCQIVAIAEDGTYIIPEDKAGKSNGSEGFNKLSTYEKPDSLGATFLLENTVDLYSGQYQDVFPLASIEGRGGLTFSLNLSYNSNVDLVATAPNYKHQVSPVGMGFTMSGQSIIADHRNTADPEDDRYRLSADGGVVDLVKVEGNRFVTRSGDPWIIIRSIDTADGIPMVVGWTIQKEDGTVFRFGDFTSDLVSPNSTHIIYHYGQFVGAGISNDDQPYPVQWDLKMIHDVDSINWLTFSYLVTGDRLKAVDADHYPTHSTHYYTQASYLQKITSSDEKSIWIWYTDRTDTQTIYDCIDYEFYYQKRARRVCTIGPNNDTAAVVSLDYDYLNESGGNKYKKLILRRMTQRTARDEQSRPSTIFEYTTNHGEADYGRVKKVRYPVGAEKSIVYSIIDDDNNLSRLDSALVTNDTWGWYSAQSAAVFTNGKNFFYYSDIPIFGRWDGYWHIDTAKIDVSDYAERSKFDEPAVSDQDWIAYYDRRLERVVVKRWKGGYWETTVVDEAITRAEDDNVYLYAGEDCMVAAVGPHGQGDFDEWTRRCYRAYYIHWSDTQWKIYSLFSNGAPSDLDAVKINGNMFAVSLEASNSYRFYSLYYGYFDAGSGMVDLENASSSLGYEFIQTNHTQHLYGRLGGRKYVIGPNYVAFIVTWGADADHGYVYFREWDGNDWTPAWHDGMDCLKTAICLLPSGFAWAEVGPYFNSASITSEGIECSGAQFVNGAAWNIETITASNHTLAAKEFVTGVTRFYEWMGAGWELASSEGGQYYSAMPVLYGDSYGFGPGLVMRRYLGNQTWTDDYHSTFPADSSTTDKLYSSGAGLTDFYLARAQLFDQAIPDSNFLYLYYPHRYGETYHKIPINFPSTEFSAPTSSSTGFYPHGGALFQLDMFMRIAGGFPDYENDIYGYQFYLDKFKGEPQLLVVDSIVLSEFSSAPDPIIQRFSFFGGILDASAYSPRFAEARVSTPYMLSDGGPDGYTQYCFFNDINNAGSDQPFYDPIVYDPEVNGDMPFPEDLSDEQYYGIPNGGYKLDGKLYYTKSYSVNGPPLPYDWPTYEYYYYNLGKVPDSESVYDVYRIRPTRRTIRTGINYTKTTHYEYDPYSGLVSQSKTTHLPANSYIVTDVSYAYRDSSTAALAAMANLMAEDNALSQVAENYNYYDSIGSLIPLNKSRWEYARHGFWQPVRSYTWRDLADEDDTLFTDRVIAFDQYGNAVERKNSMGVVTGLKYDSNGNDIVAAGTNCPHSEIIVQDFEHGSEWDGWDLNIPADGVSLDTQCVLTGRHTLKLHSDGIPLIGVTRIITNVDEYKNLYHLSAWVKTNSVARIAVLCEDENGNAPGNATKVLEYGQYNPDCGGEESAWVKVDKIIDTYDVPPDHKVKTIVLELGHAGDAICSENYVYYDNFRFHTLDAHIVTQTHDSTSGVVTSMTDIDNMPTRFNLDPFFNQVATRNFESDLIDSTYYHISDSSYIMELLDTAGCHQCDPETGFCSTSVVIDHDQYITWEIDVSRIPFNCGPGTIEAGINLRRDGMPLLGYWIDRTHGMPMHADSFEVLVGDTVIAITHMDYHTDWCLEWVDCEDVYANAEIYYRVNQVIVCDSSDTTIAGDTVYTDYAYTRSRPYYAAKFLFNSDTSAVVTATYYNGFGWPAQVRRAPYYYAPDNPELCVSDTALVDAKEYDGWGRTAKRYKPYSDLFSSTGAFDYSVPDTVDIEAAAYYDGYPGIDCQGYHYSEYKYESTYKGQISELSLPGQEWSMGSSHTTTMSYPSFPYDNISAHMTVQLDQDKNRTREVNDFFNVTNESIRYFTNGQGQSDSIVSIFRNDPLGRLRTVEIKDDHGDPMPLRTIWYNNLGWEDSTWSPDRGKERVLYDRGGRPRFIRDARGTDDSTFVYFKYDPFGRKIEEGVLLLDTLPGSGTSLFAQYLADVADFPHGDLNETFRRVAYRWTYDYDFGVDSTVDYGRVVKVCDWPETYVKELHHYPLDFKDSVSVDLLPNVSGTPKAIVHEYNRHSGDLTRFRVYPHEADTADARAYKYIYDKMNRLAAIRETGLSDDYEFIRDYIAYHYTAEDKIRDMQVARFAPDESYLEFGDSLLFCAQRLKYAYNEPGYLVAIGDPDSVVATTENGMHSTHFGARYLYQDADTALYNGRIVGITSANSASNGRIGHNYHFGYNQLGWLTEASDDSADVNRRRYDYDRLGNRISLAKGADPQVLETYYYSGANPASSILDSVTSMSGLQYAFGHDQVGNLTEIPQRPCTAMTYDYRNLLESALMDQTYGGAPANSLDFSYDESGLRIRKRYHYHWRELIGPGGGIESLEMMGMSSDGPGGGGDPIEEWEYHVDNTEWHYLYDGDKLVAIFDGGDHVKQLYINSPDGAVAVYKENNDSMLYFPVKDHLGSTRLMVDSSGAVQEYSNYHPFGGTLESWSSYKEPLKFTGKEFDDFDHFEFYYFGARYYDPEFGRFSTVDPMLEKYPSASPYSYSLNNPISLRDPNGKWIETGLDIASTALSFKDFYEEPSWENAGWLALDVVCLATPFVPAVGIVRHGTKLKRFLTAADKGADAARAVDKTLDATRAMERGLKDEKAALQALGLEKNTKKFKALDPKTRAQGATIPDAVLPSGQTVEIKSRKYLSDSPQLRRQSEVSAKAGQEAKVYTVGETKVSATVEKRMDVEPLDEMIKRSNTSGGD